MVPPNQAEMMVSASTGTTRRPRRGPGSPAAGCHLGRQRSAPSSAPEKPRTAASRARAAAPRATPSWCLARSRPGPAGGWRSRGGQRPRRDTRRAAARRLDRPPACRWAAVPQAEPLAAVGRHVAGLGPSGATNAAHAAGARASTGPARSGRCRRHPPRAAAPPAGAAGPPARGGTDGPLESAIVSTPADLMIAGRDQRACQPGGRDHDRAA